MVTIDVAVKPISEWRPPRAKCLAPPGLGTLPPGFAESSFWPDGQWSSRSLGDWPPGHSLDRPPWSGEVRWLAAVPPACTTREEEHRDGAPGHVGRSSPDRVRC